MPDTARLLTERGCVQKSINQRFSYTPWKALVQRSGQQLFLRPARTI